MEGWAQRLTNVKITSFQEIELMARYVKGDFYLREISFPESHSTKWWVSLRGKGEAGGKIRQKALWDCRGPSVHTFQAMKYGSCFDTVVIAWMFTFLVSVGFMVHKV